MNTILLFLCMVAVIENFIYLQDFTAVFFDHELAL